MKLTFLQSSSRSKLRDLFVNQNNQIITFVAAAFAVFLICVTAVYYIRLGSHEAFRFGGGDTLIEGTTNGCEPKDIIALADDLSQEPLISQMDRPKGKGLDTSLEKYPELKKSMEQFRLLPKHSFTLCKTVKTGMMYLTVRLTTSKLLKTLKILNNSNSHFAVGEIL